MSYKIITDASCNLSAQMMDELGIVYKSLNLISEDGQK